MQPVLRRWLFTVGRRLDRRQDLVERVRERATTRGIRDVSVRAPAADERDGGFARSYVRAMFTPCGRRFGGGLYGATRTGVASRAARPITE